MNFLAIIFKCMGLAILYPLMMIIVSKGKHIISRLTISLLLLLNSWIATYLFLNDCYSSPFKVVLIQIFLLFVVSVLDTSIVSWGEKNRIDPLNSLSYKINEVTNFITGTVAIIMTVVVLITYAVSSKANANTVNVQTYPTTANAPMTQIEGNSKDIPVVNNNETVNVQTKNSLSVLNHPEFYDVNHMRVQLYKGKLVYIAPLDFANSNYFTYRKARYVEGYFIIDATRKDAQPKYVKQKLYYTPKAFFKHDVKRQMYKVVAPKGLVISEDEPQLEISDNGTPYYVSTVYRTMALGTRTDFSKYWVVTVNAVTGKTSFYSVHNKPKWLDVVVSPSFAASELLQYGEYRNGFWNRRGILFNNSNIGVMPTVSGVGTEADGKVTPVLYNNKLYYFATLTSANERQTSVLAYAYIDASTGKVNIYREKDNAMTPDRAMSLAKNKKRAEKWKPAMPLLYNIDGKPTWVVSLLDSNNAFQQYSYIEAGGNGKLDTIALGDNAKDTLDAYRAKFNGGIPTPKNSSSGVNTVKKGIIDRVARFDNNNVRFMLKGDNDIYSISVSNSPQAIFLQPNDKVKITGKKTNTYVVVETISLTK